MRSKRGCNGKRLSTIYFLAGQQFLRMHILVMHIPVVEIQPPSCQEAFLAFFLSAHMLPFLSWWLIMYPGMGQQF
jgi:hypothetical protein